MKFDIGDIVKYGKNQKERYVILSSKEQPLTTDYLNSKTGKFNIYNINKLAEINLKVIEGFHYRISKVVGEKNQLTLLDEKFIDVFEDDIFR